MSPIAPNTPLLRDFRPNAPENSDALVLWQNCRGEAVVPSWHDFDPLDFANVLTHSIFLKRISEDNWVAKMFGSELVARFGADLTGINVLEVLETQNRIDATARLKYLSEGPAIVRSVNRMMSAMDVPLLVEWLLLPFAGDEGDVTNCLMVVTGLDYEIPHGQLMDGSKVGRTTLEVDIVALAPDADLKHAG